MLDGPSGTGCDDNHRDRQALKMMYMKTSAKNSSKLNKFLHSEVNMLIKHIIVQDQDGKNTTSLWQAY